MTTSKTFSRLAVFQQVGDSTFPVSSTIVEFVKNPLLTQLQKILVGSVGSMAYDRYFCNIFLSKYVFFSFWNILYLRFIQPGILPILIVLLWNKKRFVSYREQVLNEI